MRVESKRTVDGMVLVRGVTLVHASWFDFLV